MIFHITTEEKWQKAVNVGEYRAESLATEGFIHCSTREQVIKVANAFYRGQSKLIVLSIIAEKLTSEVKWESPAHISTESSIEFNELFPHVYGAINLDAVVSQVPLICNSEGLFLDF
ncbi:protein of unknown function DUF952 [Gloeothece citriformis PCC 7424]|uniref:Glutathione S-transferase domain protein n=1 Tax=Gloeothece citriformis (strain PCC 7424) TaxID=65393 RepID=B7KJS1_GLOC7|nr:DUF952 domain-containing protein [Gloeothece citriformis]ACK69520.1 protein of unknown function DUF952 [Gloeothece citriformis PCC 7424]